MPSIGKDLALIRRHLGFSVEDIQNATKIPLTTIKSIEDGSLFDKNDEIKTYVRSFVRSYGRALNLKNVDVIKALDQQETGNYNHLLLTSFPELKPDHIPENKPEPKEPPALSVKEPEKKEVTPPAKGDSPSADSTTPPPGVRSVDWADMGKKFHATKKGAPVWLIGTILIITLVIGGFYLLLTNGIFTSDNETIEDPQIQQEAPANIEHDGEGSELSLDFTDEPEVSDPGVAELDDVLYLTVYAAYNRLDPVRVWSDEKPELDPYWMSEGQAYNFEFRDTIRVRGQYSRMLLFFNGHLVEGFRDNYYNAEEEAVELTRSIFEDDPRWASPTELELPDNVSPPDSVVIRPRF